MKKKPTINKMFLDRRAMRPRWYCRVSGGIGPNTNNVAATGVGCTRWIAYRRARRNWKRNVKRFVVKEQLT